MKKILLDMLICPRCLPEEHRLQETIVQAFQEDITEGTLQCSRCGFVYPIQEGIAFLNPNHMEASQTTNRYETLPVLSSYLWSHYGDLLGDEQATDAYSRWAGLMHPSSGVCLDTGSAVGRFSFDMAKKFDFVVGIDNSVSFIRASRELMSRRQADLALPEEGVLTRQETLTFPEDWKTDNTEFIVGDAQALPLSVRSLFRSIFPEHCGQSAQTHGPSGGNQSCGRNERGPVPVFGPVFLVHGSGAGGGLAGRQAQRPFFRQGQGQPHRPAGRQNWGLISRLAGRVTRPHLVEDSNP